MCLKFPIEWEGLTDESPMFDIGVPHGTETPHSQSYILVMVDICTRFKEP
jgi:hypothetical protein